MSQIPLAGTVPDDLLFFRFLLVTFEKIFGTVRMICRTISLPFWIPNDELLFKALASLMDIGEAENKELIL